MMNDLIVKNVDVFGDSIVAAKDNNDIIWVGINYFCQGLKMNKGQRDYQVEKVKADKTLNKGCRKFPAGIFDLANEVYALRLDFIPIWLSKITITQKMEDEHPELAEKLLEYQLRAKDILADAFFQKKDVLPMSTQEQIKLLAQGNVELNQKVDNLTERMDKIELDLPILPIEADRITTAVKRKGVSVLGGKQSAAYKNRALRQSLYNNLYANLKYNFGCRSYKAIKRSQTDKAIEIVERYTPPFFLAEKIDAENAQKQI